MQQQQQQQHNSNNKTGSPFPLSLPSLIDILSNTKIMRLWNDYLIILLQGSSCSLHYMGEGGGNYRFFFFPQSFQARYSC